MEGGSKHRAEGWCTDEQALTDKGEERGRAVPINQVEETLPELSSVRTSVDLGRLWKSFYIMSVLLVK